MKNSKISLITAILFTVVGLIVFFNPGVVVKFISYFFGGLLIAIGGYKTVNYYIQDKNLGVVNQNELAFGITAIVLGLLFIFLAGTIELLLRFIIGAWLIIAGIGKLSNTFYTTDRTNKFYTLIVVGFMYIGLGLYIILVSNLALSIIGLLMSIYGVIDIVSFFLYKDIRKDDLVAIKESEVKEAIVEEKESKTKKK